MLALALTAPLATATGADGDAVQWYLEAWFE
jgi:hypothetical protein